MPSSSSSPGASAGGEDVVGNLDAFPETLREMNTRCRAGDCTLEVRGLIDSAYGPALENLGFEETEFCKAGLCTADAFLQRQHTHGAAALQGQRKDTSCLDWHARNAPGTAWQCTKSHIVANHLTTPFFLRMGLSDCCFPALRSKRSTPMAPVRRWTPRVSR